MTMAKPEWKDETSYSRADTDRTPRTWVLESKLLRVTVHRHIYYPGKWLLSCERVSVDTIPLESTEIDDAKREAVRVVYRRITELSAEAIVMVQANPPA